MSLQPKLSTPRAIQIGLFVIIAFPFFLELQNAQRMPMVPYHAHLMLATYLLAFIAIAPFIRLRLSGVKTIILAGLFLLFVLALLTGVWSQYPELVLQRSLMIFVTSILLVVVVFADRKPLDSFYMISRFIMWFGVGLSSVALLIHLFGGIVWIGDAWAGVLALGPFQLEQRLYGIPPLYRLSSLTGNPNSLAALLGYSLIATLALRFGQQMGRLKFGLLFGIQVVALVFTFSRTGIGTVAATLVLFYVLAARHYSVKCLRAIMVVALTAGFLLLLLQLAPVWIPIGIEQRLGAGLNLRDEIWLPLLALIAERPLFGVGFGVSSEAILIPHGIDASAHNAHLAIMAEVGVIGYMILMGIWFLGIYTGLALGINKNVDAKVRIAFLSIGVVLIGLMIHQVFETSVLRFGARHWLWLYLTATGMVLYDSYRANDKRLTSREEHHCRIQRFSTSSPA